MANLTENVKLRIDEATLANLERRACEEERSVASVIRRAIRQYLADAEKAAA